MMKRVRLRHVLAAASLLVMPLALADAGDAGLSLRYRAEFVNEDGFDKDALASTVLMRLNYETQRWNAWHGFVEFDYVAEVGSDNFNSAAGTSSARRSVYPVVADPNGADLNQVYVQRGLGAGGVLRVGRQRILLDNQRFVGGVGWRQNEQTYDALSVAYPFNESFEGYYAYVNNVNRVFGNDVDAGDNKSNSHLLEGRWKTAPGTLLVHAYLLDNDDVAVFSTQTVGLAWKGKSRVGGKAVDYRARYARQDDRASNPNSYSADYWRLDGGLDISAVRLELGVEILGAGDDSGGAFGTPLATLYAFNGWTDRFLSTPADGLEDRFVSVAGKVGKVGWLVVGHDFTSDRGSVDYGRELGVSFSTKLGAKDEYSVLLRGATFNGKSGFADATKAWLMVSRKVR